MAEEEEKCYHTEHPPCEEEGTCPADDETLAECEEDFWSEDEDED